ncbi:MAG: DeoR/GlpR family DNA-binding transcription regulator [Propionibacteriaceae bacterium]|nr:DeoR/GlpR family DNA-binding transcription regulator [Propionibacteriaceae bacterium]
MLTEDRQLRIVSAVRDRGFVTVQELCETLDVSEATVRRDLDALAKAGKLRRLRGGASDALGTIRPERDLRSFKEVAASASEAKRAIGAAAAGCVEDGDVIALDSGTTVAAMCEQLAERSLTVVTASLAVVDALQHARAVDLVVVGGLLRSNYRSMVGTWAEQMLGQVRVDKAFLGTSGVAADASVLDSTPSEVPIKRALMRSARSAYLLADVEKFPGSGFLRVGGLESFDYLVTDARPEGVAIPEETKLVVANSEETAA